MNTFEIVALRPSAGNPPGEAMQIAADRWLMLQEPTPLSEDFVVTDVTGKWHEVQLTGADALKVLASCVHMEELFAERGCARTALFDCPVVLQKRTKGCSVWIERSYVQAFTLAVEQALAL